MKIICAPDSFKESLSAPDVCLAIEKGFKKVLPEAEFVSLPIADGGEGTVHSIVAATGGEVIPMEVTGPLGEKVMGFYGVTGDRKTAIIEMAAASGLHLVEEKDRNPLITSTRGTGELILHALNQGVKTIVLGLGGSSTNDGGAGMAQALGVKLTDSTGQELPAGGAALAHLAQVDTLGLDPRLKKVDIKAACDVTNPLTGPFGASVVFGPQKGADPDMVAMLDHCLSHYARVLEKDLDKKVDGLEGAGAAGGLGAGIIAFLDGELTSGIDLVLDVIQFDEKVHDADLVITGEGKIDRQTVQGKAPVGVAKRAKICGSAQVVALAGSLGKGYEAVYDHGIDAAFSIVNGAVTLKDALRVGAQNVEQTSENLARLWLAAQRARGTV
ncbi:glycerate kinase family protein [Jeotgalibacillus campisalis]|uniref:Glycerate kinase n=1 Tax=Jeotgalibacillus campisalis TaxID=220754 RepID=A0A0C2RMQ7_9BACL|nr:glycerate kinase [Jeotgalibacillus campisalis]KIL43034.1 glycerate kinase [Jeotgalibacillus campisalis]